MVILKKVDIPPPIQNSGNVGRKKGFKSQKSKPMSERRRPLDDSYVYGEELFEPVHKAENQIVVHFHPYTKNMLRISSCGRFIIEQVNPEFDEVTKEYSFDGYKWNLFYFNPPLTDFEAPNKIEEFKNIEYFISSDSVYFPLIEDLDFLKAKVMEFCKREFLIQRQQILEDLREQERLNKEEKEKQEEVNDLLQTKLDEEIVKLDVSESKTITLTPTIDSAITPKTHLISGMKTKCGKMLLAVSNKTVEIENVTCEKCLNN